MIIYLIDLSFKQKICLTLKCLVLQLSKQIVQMHTWQEKSFTRFNLKICINVFLYWFVVNNKRWVYKKFPNLCWNKIVINFCLEIVCCCGEREVIKYLTSNITIHLFPVYNIKMRWMKLDRCCCSWWRWSL